ncbi:lipocalin family protein [Cellulophaga sp. F20128]|uniref:lipocalin family protein n=1 Tax=Cellulophaga sp. F20128 TaxID=2926413 RepID=UPI001FF28E2E|nr:lipocalin family protein [Cellulophaga sp. F20128]MCK0155680.1 lipocalin family protein [Cellulophaga sp. F20128]
MKHILLLLVSVSLISCGASKNVSINKKEIKGDWTLSTVSYSEAGEYAITLLNDASKACFEGSTWQFIPNNNTGTYMISDSNCGTGERNFNFTIQEVDKVTGLYDFLLKPTNPKGKSQNNVGFRLELTQLTENTMVWQQTLAVEGKPFTITMNFSKY